MVVKFFVREILVGVCRTLGLLLVMGLLSVGMLLLS